MQFLSQYFVSCSSALVFFSSIILCLSVWIVHALPRKKTFMYKAPSSNIKFQSAHRLTCKLYLWNRMSSVKSRAHGCSLVAQTTVFEPLAFLYLIKIPSTTNPCMHMHTTPALKQATESNSIVTQGRLRQACLHSVSRRTFWHDCSMRWWRYTCVLSPSRTHMHTQRHDDYATQSKKSSARKTSPYAIVFTYTALKLPNESCRCADFPLCQAVYDDPCVGRSGGALAACGKRCVMYAYSICFS